MYRYLLHLIICFVFFMAPAHAATLRLAYDAGFGGAESLDPYSPSRFFLPTSVMYNRLVGLQQDGSPGPELALSWEVSEDAKSWTFHLRPNVRFHSGKPFTAKDVVYSFDHAIDSATGSPIRSTLKIIDQVIAMDELTVRFDLRTAHADLPLLLLDQRCGIIPEGSAGSVGHSGDGTGPFKLVENDPEGITVLQANAEYWGGPPAVDRIEVVAIPNQVAQIQAMLSGQIDYLPSVSRTQLKLFEGNSDFVVQTIGTGHWTGMVMRTDREPFDNPKVRKALRVVIDRAEMVQLVVGQGGGEVACDTPVWRGDQYYVPINCQQDIDLAKQLLQQAGYADGIAVDLYTSAVDKSFVTMAEVYQNHAAKAGIQVNIHQVPADGYWTDTWMEKSFVSTRWNQRPADQILNEAFRSGAAWNESYWVNEEFDHDLSMARMEVDDEKRYRLYAKAQNMIYEQGGVIIPFHFNINRVMSAKLNNLPSQKELYIQWQHVGKHQE